MYMIGYSVVCVYKSFNMWLYVFWGLVYMQPHPLSTYQKGYIMDDLDTIIDGVGGVLLCAFFVLAYILSYAIEPVTYTTTHAEVVRE